MEREKKLAKNTCILAIGKLSSKFFTFLLLPLYTSSLLPEDYGTVDVLQTVIGLILYFVTLQIESSIFRFIIDDRQDAEKNGGYISTGLAVVFCNLIITTLIILFIHTIAPITYAALFIACLWSDAISLILRNISRGLGHNVVYSVSSFAITIVSLAINIVLILGFDIGAESILVALAVSNAVGSFIILFREKLWRYISLNRVSKEKLKEMLRYSVPLVPNAISWWVANTSDRILILAFLGSAMNGIYAAANKIPTIYTTIFSVYNLAWTESVSMAIKDKDVGEFVDTMMNRSYRALTFLAMGIICCMSLFFNVLVGENYADSYVHIYILMVAIFVNSLCSLYGGIFTAFKASRIIGVTTIIGAAVNLVFNLVFIKTIGLFAASLSTLISYIIIFFIRKHYADALIKVKWSKKFTLEAVIALGIVSFGYFRKNNILNLLILVALIIWGTANNREFVQGLFHVVQSRLFRRKDKGSL